MTIILSKPKTMQIQKEVEMYLQLCGKVHMSQDSYRTIQPGDICWLITHPHWPIFKDFNQTVTLNGNIFILEVWHEVTEEGEAPQTSGSLSINTSLKALHLRLADMAEKASRSFIASLVSGKYWEQDAKEVEKLLTRLLPAQKDTARRLIDTLQTTAVQLKDAISSNAPIERLITLTENLDTIAEDFNPLRRL